MSAANNSTHRLLKKMLRLLLSYVILAPFLLCCSYFPVSSRKYFNKAISEAPYDAVIVPGVPFNGKKWSVAMKARVYWANYLFKEGITKNVIFSGSAVYSPYVEADIMALYAEEIGIPPQHIICETEAQFSVENLYFSYKLAKERNFEKVALATDPFQARKLKKYNTHLGINIPFLPVIFDTLETIPQEDPVINADAAFVDDFVSITKLKNWREMRRGTTGKNLKPIN